MWDDVALSWSASTEQEFPDGSNPPLDLVRKFIRYADEIIKAGGKVAVHCKAGLGRSGVMWVGSLLFKARLRYWCGYSLGLTLRIGGKGWW
jgi:hypothetical protein